LGLIIYHSGWGKKEEFYMGKLTLLSIDHNDPKDICDAIRTRRGGELNELDRMLLHSPVVAEGWNIFFGKLRSETTIAPRLRELTMCVVAVLNKASYEFQAHSPLYQEAGATTEQVAELKKLGTVDFNLSLFSKLEQDVISFVKSMTQDIEVPDVLKDNLYDALGSRHLVELMAVAAGYNLVSRFLVASGIHAV
jgi:alkylhydroperoxidase family enzyme